MWEMKRCSVCICGGPIPTWKRIGHSNNKGTRAFRIPQHKNNNNGKKKRAPKQSNPHDELTLPLRMETVLSIPYLAGVDVGHQLSLPLARISPLSKEDDPRLVHVRHGAAKVIELDPIRP